VHSAWKGHPQNDYTVSGGTLNPTHSLTHRGSSTVRLQLFAFIILVHYYYYFLFEPLFVLVRSCGYNGWM